MCMIIDDLKALVEGDVSVTASDLLTHSEDASIFRVMPQVIVYPRTVADITALVQYVQAHKNSENNLSLTARSGGTDMGGGSLNDSIIVDFTRYFNHRENVVEKTITTEPGVYYRDIEKETLKSGLIMPSYPASKMICTIGGMVNNNSGGEKSLVYGQTKEYVEELHVVLSDGNEYVVRPLDAVGLEQKMAQADFEGEVYRKVFALVRDNYELIQSAKPTTSKNSSGYFLWDVWNKETGAFNLVKLLTGAQGTLGFVTKIKLRLIHLPPKSELLVIFLNDLHILGELVHTVVQHKPETFESYDKHTFGLALRFLPDMIKRMKGNSIKLGLQFLPELWMTLTGGVPNLVLIAEFTGETDQAIASRIAIVREEVERLYRVKTHITQSPEETAKYWTIRRESFNLLRQHAKGRQTAPFIDDIIVHPDQLPEFLPRLNAIFAKYPHLIYTIAGHAGDANFHIIPLMDLTDMSQHEIISQLSHEVYDLVLEYKGSITAEHNDGLIRTPYLEKMYGSKVTALFKDVKQIFDPLNMFNPRKKVGATEAYALAHIKR